MARGGHATRARRDWYQATNTKQNRQCRRQRDGKIHSKGMDLELNGLADATS